MISVYAYTWRGRTVQDYTCSISLQRRESIPWNHISDFGPNRLACTAEEPLLVNLEHMARVCSHTNKFRPTISSNEAPHASKASKPSQKWDAYSYGVILLWIISAPVSCR